MMNFCQNDDENFVPLVKFVLSYVKIPPKTQTINLLALIFVTLLCLDEHKREISGINLRATQIYENYKIASLLHFSSTMTKRKIKRNAKFFICK
jgi:hypothetical protein